MPCNQVRFTTPDDAHTYTLDEMEKVMDVRWPYMEPATLTVLKPGGHNVQVVQKDRMSCMPVQPGVCTYRKKMTTME
jgi:hypothetical protein